MATRDLTSKFIQVRADAKARSVRRRRIQAPDEVNSLMKDEEVREWDNARHALPPIWVDAMDDVRENVIKIKKKMNELNGLHKKRLMVSFANDEFHDEEQIEAKTHEITTLFRFAEKVLKKLVNGQLQNERDSCTASDTKIRQNVQRSFATQLQTMSTEFRKSQKGYLSRIKAQKQSGPAEFDFLSSETSSSSKALGFKNPGLNQDQMFEMELAEDVINERDTEIAQITSSIEELSTIFKELAVLVIDQGTVLDRIDYNMEQVMEQTEKGLDQLEKAERTQKSSRGMKCIGILLTFITLMTIILILKHV